MNKKLLLFLSIICFSSIKITTGGYIYNKTKSPIYYGNENSTWLSSIAPEGYCGVKNYYIVYPQNNATGPALWIDFISYSIDNKLFSKVKTETYKCYMINGSIYLKEKNPTINTNYTKYWGSCLDAHAGFSCLFDESYMKVSIYDKPELPGTFFVNSNSNTGYISNKGSSSVYFNTVGDGTIYPIAPNTSFRVGVGSKFLIYPSNNANGKALYLEYNNALGKNVFKTCFIKNKSIDTTLPQGEDQIFYGEVEVYEDPVSGLFIVGN